MFRHTSPSNSIEIFLLSVSGSPDILICGNCREMFSDLVDMLDHKKYYCKLRFTCKCDSANENSGPGCQAEGGCSINNNNNNSNSNNNNNNNNLVKGSSSGSMSDSKGDEGKHNSQLFERRTFVKAWINFKNY